MKKKELTATINFRIPKDWRVLVEKKLAKPTHQSTSQYVRALIGKELQKKNLLVSA